MLSNPQKAKDVLTEPVVLFTDIVNVLVNGAPGVHELQISPPVNFVSTTSRSLELHEVFGGGKVSKKVVIKLTLPQESVTFNFIILLP